MEPNQIPHAELIQDPQCLAGAQRDLKALVFRRGLAVLVGRVREIGLLGMYLSSDGPGLPKHTLVEVGFSVGQPGPTQFIRLPAMIARTDPHGIGLIFDSDDDVTRTKVRHLLRAWRG